MPLQIKTKSVRAAYEARKKKLEEEEAAKKKREEEAAAAKKRREDIAKRMAAASLKPTVKSPSMSLNKAQTIASTYKLPEQTTNEVKSTPKYADTGASMANPATSLQLTASKFKYDGHSFSTQAEVDKYIEYMKASSALRAVDGKTYYGDRRDPGIVGLMSLTRAKRDAETDEVKRAEYDNELELYKNYARSNRATSKDAWQDELNSANYDLDKAKNARKAQYETEETLDTDEVRSNLTAFTEEWQKKLDGAADDEEKEYAQMRLDIAKENLATFEQDPEYYAMQARITNDSSAKGNADKAVESAEKRIKAAEEGIKRADYFDNQSETYAAISTRPDYAKYDHNIGTELTMPITSVVGYDMMGNPLTKLENVPIDKTWGDYSYTQYMNTQQRADAYYLMNTQGEKAAFDYITNYLSYDLEKLRADDMRRKNAEMVVTGNGWDKTVATLGSVFQNAYMGAAAFADAGLSKIANELNPDNYTPIHYDSLAATNAAAGSDTRQLISTELSDKYGGWAGFLYNTGTSMLDSAAVMPLGSAGSAVLGLATGQNKLKELTDSGISEDEAFTMATAAAVFEAAFEYISLDKLIHAPTPDGLKNALKNVAVQAGIEASEEMSTELAYTIFDNIKNGSGSEYQRNIQNYIENGYTQQEAYDKAAQDWISNFLLDGLGGAVSGGVMGSAGQAVRGMVQSVYDSARAQEIGARIRKSGNMPEFANTYKSATGKSAGSTQSDRSIGRSYEKLMNEAEKLYGSSVAAEDAQAITAAYDALAPGKKATQVMSDTENSYGNPAAKSSAAAKPAKQVSARTALAKYARGEKLTRAETTAISNDAAAFEIRKQLDSAKNGGIAPEWYSSIDRKASGKLREKLANAKLMPYTKAKEAAKPDTIEPAEISIDENALGSSVADEDGETRKGYIKGIAKVGKDARLLMELNGKTEEVPISSVTIGKSDNGGVIQYAVQMPTPEAAQWFRKTYRSGDVGAQAAAFKQAFTQAAGGATMNFLKASRALSVLSHEQFNAAYAAGHGLMSSAVKTPPVSANPDNVKPAKWATGNIDMSGIKTDISELSEEQASQIELVGEITRISGLKVKLFESEPDSEGSFLHAANGNFKDGIISIDINAGRNKAGDSIARVAMLRTMSHEITHAMKSFTPENYEIVKNLVLDRLSESVGIDVDELRARKIELNPALEGHEDTITDEIVADGCETMLRDSSTIAKFYEQLPREATTIRQKLHEIIAKIRDGIKGFFSGERGAHTQEAIAIEKNMSDIQSAWDKAFYEAAAKRQLILQELNSGERASSESADSLSTDSESIDIKDIKYTEDTADIEDSEDIPGSAEYDISALAASIENARKFAKKSNDAGNVGAFNEPAKPESAHIDRRDESNVRGKTIKAFTNEYKLSRVYFAQAAEKMQSDLRSSTKGERFPIGDSGEWNGVKRDTTEAIAYLLDEGKYSYDELDKALTKFTELKESGDFESEMPNTNIIKHVEIALDGEMTHGSVDLTTGTYIPRNEDYIIYKELLPGASELSESYLGIDSAPDNSISAEMNRGITYDAEELSLKYADFENTADTSQYDESDKYQGIDKEPSYIDNVKFSLRQEDTPKKTGIAYKVFFEKNGKLYPPMVANPGGADTPVGVWLNADVGMAAQPSKTGRLQVKAGGKGTQGGNGSLAFRPGWHLGDIPRASQFNRLNPDTGIKELFPSNFVWAECEYAMDVDYQEEAMSYGYTESGKFRHAYAGLPRLPENGFYHYRTNPDPSTVPWVITGAMKVNRILTHAEVDEILASQGVEPTKWQGADGKEEARDAVYSLRDPSEISNRELLADALVHASLNPREDKLLVSYKKGIEKYDDIDRNLRQLKSRIRELTYGKYSRTAETRDELVRITNQAKSLSEQLADSDKTLLNIEAMSPMKNIIAVERKKVAEQQSIKNKERTDKLLQKQKEALEAKVLAQIERANRIRDKAAADIKTAKTEQREKDIENQQNAKQRDRISKSVKMLDALLRLPSDQKHVPDGFKGAVLSYCSLFTENTSVFDRVKLERVRNEYANLAAGGINADTTLAGMYDFDIAEEISEISDTIGGRRLSELTANELDAVERVTKHFSFIVKNENAIFVNGRMEEISGYAQSVAYAANGIIHKSNAFTRSPFWKLLSSGQITPAYFFKHLGGAMGKLGNEILSGETAYGVGLQQAKYNLQELMRTYSHSDWANVKGDTLMLNTEKGDSMELTREMALGIYATSMREKLNTTQKASHLATGGVVLDEHGKKRSALRMSEDSRASAMPLSARDVARIEEWLTDEQKNYANAVVDYISTRLSAMGNEVSMRLHGYEKFTEGYYYPYKTSADFRKTDLGKTEQALIKNMGFTKRTTHQANNPIVLSDFTDTCAEHISSMLTYSAFAVPQDNFMRVYDFNLDKSTSVKSIIKTAYGQNAANYIMQFMRDIYGGAVADHSEDIFQRMISTFKKNAVLGSLSVAIQQPSAIMRSMALINPKYFIGNPLSGGWHEALMYAGTAVLKDLGRFDMNMGRTAAKWITAENYDTIGQKSAALITDSEYRADKLGFLPELMDKLTWARIWNAVKREQAAETGLAIDSEELLNAAGKRFDVVIRYTQVYDSVMARSEIMRSRSALVRMATAFLAESTLSYNLLADAASEGKNGNHGNASRAIAAFVLTTMVNSLLKSLIYAMRDDDEEKSYIEKYFTKLFGGFLSDIAPWNMIPIARDVAEIFSGYEIERSDMSVISDIYESASIAMNSNKSMHDRIQALSSGLGMLTGIPVRNVWRDIEGALNTLSGNGKSGLRDGYITYAAITVLGYDDTKSANIDRLLQATIDGDTENINELIEHLSAYNGLDEAGLHDAYISALKSEYLISDMSNANAAKLLKSYGGQFDDEIAEKIGAWAFEREYGAKYSDMKNLFMSGDISAAQAEQYRTKFGGEAADEAHNTVQKWQFEKSQGYPYSEIRSRLLAGEISPAKALEFQTKYGGVDENTAYWAVRGWQYMADNGTDKYSKFDEVIAAAQGGNGDIYEIINDIYAHSDYADAQACGSAITSAITKYYKSIYIEASESERARLEIEMLPAYRAAYEGVGRDYIGDKRRLAAIRDWLDSD